MSTVLTLTLAAALAAQAPAPPAARFALAGSLTRLPASSPDARFQLQGSPHLAAPADSTPGRFANKSVNGSLACGPAVDTVFKNGFE
jgi:hypothetical protein